MKKQKPSPLLILRGHTRPISAIHFLKLSSCSSRYLLTGDESGTIRLWDIQFEETILVIPLPHVIQPSPVLSIIQDINTTDTIVVQYKNGYVFRIHLTNDPNLNEWQSWKVSKTTDIQQRLPKSFCRIKYISPTQWAAPFEDGDQSIIINDNKTKNNIIKIPPLPTPSGQRSGMLMAVNAIYQFNGQHDPNKLLSGYEDGTIAVWDLRQTDQPASRVQACQAAILTVACSPFGHVAVTAGGFDSLIAIADVEHKMNVIREVDVKAKGAGDLTWQKNGKLIASAGWDGVVRLWQGKRTQKSLLTPVVSLRWHDNSVHCIDFSDDGKLLASGSADRTVAVWDAQL